MPKRKMEAGDITQLQTALETITQCGIPDLAPSSQALVDKLMNDVIEQASVTALLSGAAASAVPLIVQVLMSLVKTALVKLITERTTVSSTSSKDSVMKLAARLDEVGKLGAEEAEILHDLLYRAETLDAKGTTE